MVRTKANAGGSSTPSSASRTSYSKAPRKMYGRQGGGNASVRRVDIGSPSPWKDKFSGGNSVCPRPTPKWQKTISTFFNSNPSTEEEKHSETEKENEDPSGEKSEAPATQQKLAIPSSPGRQVIRNECIAPMNDDISEDA